MQVLNFTFMKFMISPFKTTWLFQSENYLKIIPFKTTAFSKIEMFSKSIFQDHHTSVINIDKMYSFHDHHTITKWKLAKISSCKTIKSSQSENYPKLVLQDHDIFLKCKLLKINSFKTMTASQIESF